MSLSELSREFLEACRHGGSLRKIKEYIEAGADVNVQDSLGTTAAMFAVTDQNVGLLQMLSERSDIDCNIQNEDGNTVALLATKLQQYDFLQMLLQNQTENIDWNIQNKEGNTVAIYLCFTGGNGESIECLKMLS